MYTQKMTEVSFRADRFAKLMKTRGFTDGKLAYASGVSRTMIYYMRKGERQKVSAEIIAKVADPLGTSSLYLMDETDDPSPVQKKMSALAADIVKLVDKLPPSKQREFQELGKAILQTEQNATVETIYSDLMERITRLAEIDGGEEALDRLIDHLNSVSGRSSGPSVTRPTARKRRSKPKSETPDEPSKSSD